VLLLDEFDAIAKRRDDTSDVGELKRLVTVLLQNQKPKISPQTSILTTDVVYPRCFEEVN
jgi:SpoVK/Ycf46/Vps4 family AAA+-type ATPase